MALNVGSFHNYGCGPSPTTPTEDMKKVHIGPLEHQVTKLYTSLYECEEDELVNMLRRNIDLFTLGPSNMPCINTRVVSHPLTIDPIIKSVS